MRSPKGEGERPGRTPSKPMPRSAPPGGGAWTFRFGYMDLRDPDASCAGGHRHPGLEYLFVQSGQAVCYADGERVTLDEGCGLLINGGVVHRVEAGAGAVVPFAVYSPFFAAPEESGDFREYLAPFLYGGPAFVRFDPAVTWQLVCIMRMLEVFGAQEEGECDPAETIAPLRQFWRTLHRNLQPPHENKPAPV